MSTRKLLVRSIFFATAIAVAACAGKDMKVETISPSANPSEQISQFVGMVNSAKNESVEALAPNSFKQADESLAEAKKLQDRGGNLTEIFEAVAEGRAHLKKANESARVAKTAFPKAIEARSDARDAGAAQFDSEYEEIEKSFASMAKSVEGGNLNAAKRNEDRIVKSYRALELKAIKERTLGEARKLIGKAIAQGAPKLAPKTLKQTEKLLSDTEQFISANPYAKEEMRKRADNVLFYSNRLLVITNQSKNFAKKTPEDIALWGEQSYRTIAAKLSAPDMRNQMFSTQLENIQGSIDRLHKDHAFLLTENKTLKNEVGSYKTEVAALQGETKDERLAKERLEAEKKFNQLYSEVSRNFDKSEAEVYKEGDKLVVRLKTIKFPVGQHVIMPANYPLLSKVQRTIRTFGESSVVIEGHTDSTGSATLNEHLSKMRADAVRSYLLANNTMDEGKISAVGFGENRPLVANTTADGRATNRRIDVIIQPKAPNSK